MTLCKHTLFHKSALKPSCIAHPDHKSERCHAWRPPQRCKMAERLIKNVPIRAPSMAHASHAASFENRQAERTHRDFADLLLPLALSVQSKPLFAAIAIGIIHALCLGSQHQVHLRGRKMRLRVH